MELFKLDFLSVTFFDLLDIALVSFIFYKLFIILRGTRAYQMFIGFVVLLSFSFLAEATQLKGMTWLIDNIRAVWVVVFVILFQAELRRFLILLGQSKLVTSFLKHEITNFMDALLEALENLSTTKTGALIVFEKDTGLKAIIETGLTLRADITKELLISIFNKNSPLHDGAVVIRDNLVEAATCFLPLTQNTNLPHELGTRHRAGIGVTEESDALVLIVSEETGKISMASNGILSRDLTIKEVKENLQKELSNLNG